MNLSALFGVWGSGLLGGEGFMGSQESRTYKPPRFPHVPPLSVVGFGLDSGLSLQSL